MMSKVATEEMHIASMVVSLGCFAFFLIPFTLVLETKVRGSACDVPFPSTEVHLLLTRLFLFEEKRLGLLSRIVVLAISDIEV